MNLWSQGSIGTKELVIDLSERGEELEREGVLLVESEAFREAAGDLAVSRSEFWYFWGILEKSGKRWSGM